jgi:hypothetical protein
MEPHVRSAVAAISLSHANSKTVSSIYSYSESQYLSISVSINNNSVNGYDYTNQCHISGNLPNLYHYGDSHHIELKAVSLGNYSGYDYGSNSHFTITIRSNSAEIYDYGAGGWFSYSI